SCKYVRCSQEISNCVQYNPPAQCFPVQTAFPPLAGNTEYTRAMQQQIVWQQNKNHAKHCTQGTQSTARRGP
ncbi:MAG: hypothetical protein ACK56F_02890, partial [bacterium]